LATRPHCVNVQLSIHSAVAPEPIAVYRTGYDHLAWACDNGCRWDWHRGTGHGGSGRR